MFIQDFFIIQIQVINKYYFTNKIFLIYINNTQQAIQYKHIVSAMTTTVESALGNALCSLCGRIGELSRSHSFDEFELCKALNLLFSVYNQNISIIKKTYLKNHIFITISDLKVIDEHLRDSMAYLVVTAYNEVKKTDPSQEGLYNFMKEQVDSYTRLFNNIDIVVSCLSRWKPVMILEINANDNRQGGIIDEGCKIRKNSRRRYPSKKVTKTYTNYWTSP